MFGDHGFKKVVNLFQLFLHFGAIVVGILPEQ